jgi:hypothetical protein
MLVPSQPTKLAFTGGGFSPHGVHMIDEKLRALPRNVPDFHERQAAHLRALAEATTTAAIKKRLVRQAEAHEEAHEQVSAAQD